LDTQTQQQLREWRSECLKRVRAQLRYRDVIYPSWDEKNNRYFFKLKNGELVRLPDKEAGNYVFYSRRTGTPVYVGETDNLKRRLENHCRVSGTSVFKRRWVRHWIGSQTSEPDVVRFIHSHMFLKYLIVPFGRCEIEADLCAVWKLSDPQSVDLQVF